MGLAAFNRMRRLKAEQEASKELSPTHGYAVPIEQKQPRSLQEYTVKELKALAKERGLTGYSKLNEAELIELIVTGGNNE